MHLSVQRRLPMVVALQHRRNFRGIPVEIRWAALIDSSELHININLPSS